MTASISDPAIVTVGEHTVKAWWSRPESYWYQPTDENGDDVGDQEYVDLSGYLDFMCEAKNPTGGIAWRLARFPLALLEYPELSELSQRHAVGELLSGCGVTDYHHLEAIASTFPPLAVPTPEEDL